MKITLNKILNEIEINIKVWVYMIFIFPVNVYKHMKEKELNLIGAMHYEILQLEHEEEKLTKKCEEDKKAIEEEIIKEVERILKEKGILK
jgi:hypothetical protein